jgi:hypothetical protein
MFGSLFGRDLFKATQLTRSAQPTGASALLQRVLRGEMPLQPASDAGGAAAEPEGGAPLPPLLRGIVERLGRSGLVPGRAAPAPPN